MDYATSILIALSSIRLDMILVVDGDFDTAVLLAMGFGVVGGYGLGVASGEDVDAAVVHAIAFETLGDGFGTLHADAVVDFGCAHIACVAGDLDAVFGMGVEEIGNAGYGGSRFAFETSTAEVETDATGVIYHRLDVLLYLDGDAVVLLYDLRSSNRRRLDGA